MLLSALALLGAATPAHASNGSGNGQVVVLEPLSFVNVTGLNFGNIIPGTAAGTVVLAPAGTLTTTGPLTTAGGNPGAATFEGKGSFGQSVLISMSANAITLTGPGAPMRVDTWVIGSTPTAPLSTNPRRFRIVSLSGIFGFPVGATLHVNANQAGGTYNGTFAITLVYQ